MKIRIVAVGRRQPEWVEHGVTEYIKRLPKHLGASVVEVAAEDRKLGGSPEQCAAREAERISKQVGRGRVVALDEGGQPISTRQFAKALKDWQQDGADVHFLIGGPDGLDADLLASANARWSLSGLTLPHGLARLVLAEALYRAWTVTQNHPYHRE